MSWLSKLLRRQPNGDATRLVELRCTRFRQLLRSFGALLDLAADAAEKQDGDFILDRQYVVSLAERSFDLTDSMLFDLEVVTGRAWPEGAARLLALRDSVRTALARPPTADVADANGASADDEPEYLLLRGIRGDLFTPTLPPGEPPHPARCASLLDIAHLAHLEAGARVAALLARGERAFAHAVEVDLGRPETMSVVDLGGALEAGSGGSAHRRAGEVRSRPLAAVVAGVAAAMPAAVPVDLRALATGEHVFLVAGHGDGELLLDSLLAADDRLNHLYLRGRAGAAGGGRRRLVAGLQDAEVGTWRVLWRHGLPQATLRAALAEVGRLAAGGEAGGGGEAASPDAGGTESREGR